MDQSEERLRAAPRALWLAAALAVLAALAFLGGCRGHRDNEVVIGVIAARTGGRALWGEDLYRGIEYAVEQQNARGGLLGRRVRLAVLDDASREEQAGSLAVRLIEREGAVAVLCELSTPACERAAAAAGRRGVPLIAPASTMRDVSRVNEFAFRTALTDAEQAQALARYARQQQRRRAAIVYRRNSLLHMAIGNAFAQAFRASGGEVVLREAFGDEDTEMVHLAARVRGAGADVLFVPAFATDAARVAVAARHGRVNALLMGSDGWSSPELRRFAAESVVGALISDAFSAALERSDVPQRPVVEQFVQGFRRRYRAEPGTFAALGYDAARWLLVVAARVPSLEPRALRDALAGSRLDESVAGALEVDARRMLTRPVNVLRVEREGMAFVATATP